MITMMSGDCHYQIVMVPQDVIREALLGKDGEWNHPYRGYHEIRGSRHPLLFPAPPPPTPLPICIFCIVGMGPVG